MGGEEIDDLEDYLPKILRNQRKKIGGKKQYIYLVKTVYLPIGKILFIRYKVGT